MGFWTVAKEAMDKALEVYEGLAKLAATVDQMRGHFIDFRDETRKRITSEMDEFRKRLIDQEQRVDNKLLAMQKHQDDQLDRLDKRLRELESRLSQLEGKASAALAEAYAAILRTAFQHGRMPTLTQVGIDNAPAQFSEPSLKLSDPGK